MQQNLHNQESVEGNHKRYKFSHFFKYDLIELAYFHWKTKKGWYPYFWTIPHYVCFLGLRAQAFPVSSAHSVSLVVGSGMFSSRGLYARAYGIYASYYCISLKYCRGGGEYMAANV